jgi:very-short-patch-repair endonuclease
MKAKEEYIRQLELINKSTKSEIVIRKLLDANNIEYIQNYPVKINDKCTFFVDFYLLDYNCYLEIDGAYHFTEEQRKKDSGRRTLIRVKRKWKEIRISNRQCFKININYLYKLILSDNPIKKNPNRIVKKKKPTKKSRLLFGGVKYPDPNIIRKH